MGMYDEIICEMQLPNNPPSFAKMADHRFQTKDLECMLNLYKISKDGHPLELIPHLTPEIVAKPKNFNFHTSNIVGSGPGIYTANGEDAESIEYAVIFNGDKVSAIREVERSLEPALPRSAQGITFPNLTKEEIAEMRSREAEPLIGKTLYVLWGGQEKGYPVKVIAENEDEICVILESDAEFKRKGSFELLDRRSRDNTFFDSEAEAFADKNRRTSHWTDRKAKYDKYAQEWRDKRGPNAHKS